MKNEKADSIQINRRYLDSLVIEGRVIGTVHPDSRVTVLGKTFETPIVPGALSHLKDGMAGYAEGAKRAGALCSIGMGSVEEMEAVYAAYPEVIKVIKPYADKEEIFSRIRAAERLPQIRFEGTVKSELLVRGETEGLKLRQTVSGRPSGRRLPEGMSVPGTDPGGETAAGGEGQL